MNTINALVMNRKVIRIILGSVLCIQLACKSDNKKLGQNNTTIEEAPLVREDVIAKLPGQFPEGIEFDKNRNLFFLSAINKNPSIAAIDFDGNAKPFSNDSGLKPRSSFGLQIDYDNNRLLACTNNSESGSVNFYNLETGELEHLVNLSTLLAEGEPFQANDLIVGSNNQIYVTGRIENTIYRVDEELNASIFFLNEALEKPNGIVYHNDDYLVVSCTNKNSKLVKIPISNPNDWKEIVIEDLDFVGFDGMILTESGTLVGVSKAPTEGFGFAIELSSADGWNTAKVKNKKSIRRSTTIAQIGLNEYYVVNQDWKNRDAETWTLEHVKF